MSVVFWERGTRRSAVTSPDGMSQYPAQPYGSRSGTSIWIRLPNWPAPGYEHGQPQTPADGGGVTPAKTRIICVARSPRQPSSANTFDPPDRSHLPPRSSQYVNGVRAATRRSSTPVHHLLSFAGLFCIFPPLSCLVFCCPCDKKTEFHPAPGAVVAPPGATVTYFQQPQPAVQYQQPEQNPGYYPKT